MSKKLIIGLLTIWGVLLLSGTAVYAVTHLPNTENIFTISDVDDCDNGIGGSTRCATISTFKHNGNRCYVIANRNGGVETMSCVRFE